MAAAACRSSTSMYRLLKPAAASALRGAELPALVLCRPQVSRWKVHQVNLPLATRPLSTGLTTLLPSPSGKRRDYPTLPASAQLVCAAPLSGARWLATGSEGGSGTPPERSYWRLAGHYVKKAGHLVWVGVKQVTAVKSNVERALLRTGLVKDADTAGYIGTTASMAVWTFAGLTLAGTLGVDTKPLLAGVGITGFTLGFALKDIASNYLSGVFLLMNRPFRPGMLVTIGDPGKKVRGTYIKMDLRYLYLRTDRDGADMDTILLVPNSIVFASDISVSQPKSSEQGGDKNGHAGTLYKITHG